MSERPPMVVLEGLTRRFRDLVAVDSLTLTVGRGELFGLVGPDGAGKTTTLRMLSGVLRPSAGDARLDGVSVVREPERVKHAIAYMSQRFGLYADLTVAENLEFYAGLYKVPRPALGARLERLYQFSALGPFQSRLARAVHRHREHRRVHPALERVDRVERQRAAVLQQDEAVEALGLVHVGGAHHHRGAARHHLVHDEPQVAARDRVHAEGGLVEQQDRGFVHQAAGEGELLLHPARQLAGKARLERA